MAGTGRENVPGTTFGIIRHTAEVIQQNSQEVAVNMKGYQILAIILGALVFGGISVYAWPDVPDASVILAAAGGVTGYCLAGKI